MSKILYSGTVAFLLMIVSCGGEENVNTSAPSENKNEDSTLTENVLSLDSLKKPGPHKLRKALDVVEDMYSGEILASVYIHDSTRSVFWASNKSMDLPELGILEDKGKSWEILRLNYPVEAVPAYGFPQFSVEHVYSEIIKNRHVIWAAVHITGQGGVAEGGERPEIDEYAVIAFVKNDRGEYEYDADKSAYGYKKYMAKIRNEKMQWMSIFKPGVKMDSRRDVNQFITQIMSHRTTGQYIQALIKNGITYCCNCPPYSIGFSYSENDKNWIVFYDLIQDSRNLYIHSVTRHDKYWELELELQFLDTVLFKGRLDTLWLDSPITRLTLYSAKNNLSELSGAVFINDLQRGMLPENPEPCDLDEGY